MTITPEHALEAALDAVNAMRDATRPYKSTSTDWNTILEIFEKDYGKDSAIYGFIRIAADLQKVAEEIGLARPFGDALIDARLRSFWAYSSEVVSRSLGLTK